MFRTNVRRKVEEDLMPETALPFHSFTFTLIADRKPRAAFRMTAREGGMFELHVERGSASNPTSQFTREVPLEVAQRLKDALQELGVFGWDESYGDAKAPGSQRWSVNTVFKEGVFSVASKGGSDVPAGFDGLLEELYRLDFPRPDAVRSGAAASQRGVGLGTALNSMGSLGMGGIGGMSLGDMGAYGAAGKGGVGGVDFSQLGELLGGAGEVPGMGDLGDFQQMFAEMQRNPQAMQQRMKDEFRHMSPDEQNRMLDALASTGMASRAWWERFLRGL